MANEIRNLDKKDWPFGLSQIPDGPKKLRIAGSLPPQETILLCVVGSRKYSNYGRSACEHLISGLRGFPVSIISGMALGIDSIAHKAALAAGLHTIAVPGSGLSEKVLYPRSHFALAREIVGSGGALISEFEDDFRATPWSFPQRNRIMAGISKAVLIIEASKKSGTLITSRLASEYNRDVLVVPGSIFNEGSEGPNMLLSLGATPITNSEDLLKALGFSTDNMIRKVSTSDLNPDEKIVYEALSEKLSRDDITERTGLPTHLVSIAISILELKGLIRESGGYLYKI